MAKGKTLTEAGKITKKAVAEALGGLPQNKMHCSNLGADALALAIQNYQEKRTAPPRKARRTERKSQ
jgi:nitrogen fixation protein NifU and related proteins